VILRDTVAGLGRRGAIVDVADGYARNYLIPKGLASRSFVGAEEEASRMRRAAEERDARERSAAEDIARVLAPLVFKVRGRASGGRLFGSISATELVESVYAQTGHELNRRSLNLDEPIKTTGMHSVPASLHHDVQIFLQIEVEGV
jgi:large subunit ribosomal protein L9